MRLHEADRIGEGVVAEAERGALRARIDLLHQRHAAQRLDRDDLEQVFHFVRQCAEAVDQLGGEAIDLVAVLDGREPAIERHAHIEIGHIGFRDQDRRADIDLRRPLIGKLARRLARAHLRDGFLQHLLIKLDAHFAHMAGLFFAEQIARAANIESWLATEKPAPS